MRGTIDWLDQAQARADAAADGPWHENAGNVCDARASRVATLRGSYSEAVSTADFIAAARTDLPAAIAALRAVLDLADEWQTRDPSGLAHVAIRRTVSDALGVAQ